ncbi:sensor histidine kinase [Cryobacterium sp. TMT1-66-1]|uniref:sensor histidine kinase n=1 Tax=Cryobacterium sp. TMT1-66-1 TaxID=1259242 RepID=UPI00106DBEEF|nr:ATP-binding protein [Cryobacterium sp. TMT1-66-1]TFD04984.1 histidine kinase [Cryobacterium sp. TMT1-66-1]
MQRILKERDRLLRRAVQAAGLVGTATTLACLLVPGGLEADARLWCLVLVLFLAVGQYLLGSTGALRWAVLTVLSGEAIILIVGFASHPAVPLNLIEESVIGMVSTAPMCAVAAVLLTSPRRILLLVASFAVTIASVAVVTVNAPDRTVLLALTVSMWLAFTLAAWWIAQSVPRVMHRIAAIGRAHRAERYASELEAQRRQDARLLHDTVLATLTLLAHSGVGVSPIALQKQAGDDARLLRQLRLGGLPTPRRSGVYSLEPASVLSLGDTLDAVRQRFERMGLTVNWHGSGQVQLSSNVLDSFLLALSECLENVRRHSGVDHADVTITDDARTVRAMVTDTGVGFDLGQVGTERLGVAESVIARLRDVGGNARLFSSPGAGTTVVLEVPK